MSCEPNGGGGAGSRHPRLACCNFLPDMKQLRELALDCGFDGVDWSFTAENLPRTPLEETALVKSMGSLHPLEVRYHCAFRKADPGDADPEEARKALDLFRRACRLTSKLGGRVLTIHIGLGRDSTHHLVWERVVEDLAWLVRLAGRGGVSLCLENLAWGWTSRPELYEKLIRKSGAWATLDIGHARVSPWVVSEHYGVEDFVLPHPERFLNAHVYHEERDDRHVAPEALEDVEDRLELLATLPLCDWWVLELREEGPLLQTLAVVRDFRGREGLALDNPSCFW